MPIELLMPAYEAVQGILKRKDVAAFAWSRGEEKQKPEFLKSFSKIPVW